MYARLGYVSKAGADKREGHIEDICDQITSIIKEKRENSMGFGDCRAQLKTLLTSMEISVAVNLWKYNYLNSNSGDILSKSIDAFEEKK